MTLRIIDQRPLTDEELHFYEQVFCSNSDMAILHRRELLKAAAGAGLLATVPVLFVATPTNAQLPALMRAAIRGGVQLSQAVYRRYDQVSARFRLVNAKSSRSFKPIYTAIKGGVDDGVLEADFLYVELPPKSQQTVEDDNLKTTEIGQNAYLAKTGINEAMRSFGTTI